MLTDEQKTAKVSSALRQLRGELVAAHQYNQCAAITDYLLSASNESFVRLHDLLNPQPRSLGELIDEEIAAGRMG